MREVFERGKFKFFVSVEIVNNNLDYYLKVLKYFLLHSKITHADTQLLTERESYVLLIYI